MRKIFFLFLLFFTFVFSVFAQIDDIQSDAVNFNAIYPSQSFDTNNTIIEEHIRSFQSEIKINKDGTIDVKETIVYDFENLEKHGIYRTIPYVKTNNDGKRYKLLYSDISVRDENNKPYIFSKTKDKNNIKLKIGDPSRLISGIHTYVINYKVSGAITYFSDHDELYWNVTGNEWTVPIYFARAQITMPQPVEESRLKLICYTGTYGSNLSDCQINNVNGLLLFDTNEKLTMRSGLTIVLSFPTDIVARLEPKEIISFWDTFIGKLVKLLINLLLIIWYLLLPFFIIYRWFKYGRDPKGTVGLTNAWYDPPKTPDGQRFLTPGEVGTLGDETVDLKDISATIVDLARRGYLKIIEKKKNDYYLERQDISHTTASVVRGDNLLEYERMILNKFFKSKKEIRLKDKNLYDEVEKVKESLYKQTVADGLFLKDPNFVRSKYYLIGVLAIFTFNLPLAFVSFVFGKFMPRKTVEGVNAKNIAFSLRNFLKSQERQLTFQADKKLIFEKLLPYAIVFGVEKVWAKRFADLNISPPDWYIGYHTGSFNSSIFVDNLNSSISSFRSAATPTRSSSGFSSGFSGGFSGGGFGGGGGGSW